MEVKIMFQTSSVAQSFTGVNDVYTKDALLCISFKDKKTIIKFPLCNIFSIVSDYED